MPANDRLLMLYRRSSIVPVGIDSSVPAGAKSGQPSRTGPKSRFRVERIPLLPDQIFKYLGIGGSDDEEEEHAPADNKSAASKASPALKIKSSGGTNTDGSKREREMLKGRGSSAQRKSDSQSIPSFRCSLPPKELFQPARQSSETNAAETASNDRASSGESGSVPSFRASLPNNSVFHSTICESSSNGVQRSKRESQESWQSAASSAPSTPLASRRREVFAPRSLNKRTQTDVGATRQKPSLPNFSFKPSDHGLALSPANETAGNGRNESVFPSFRLSFGRASLFQSTLYNDTVHTQSILHQRTTSMLNVDVSETNTNTSTNTVTPVKPLRRTDVLDYNNWDEGLLTPDSERRQQSADLASVESSPADEIIIPEQVSPIKKIWSNRVIDCRKLQPATIPTRAVVESPKQSMPFYLSHRKAMEERKPVNNVDIPNGLPTARQPISADEPTATAPLKSAMKRPPTQPSNSNCDGALKEICMNYGSPSPVEDVQNRRKSRISFYEPHKVLNDSESLCTTAGVGKSPVVNSPPAKSFKHTHQSVAVSPPAAAAGRRRSVGTPPSSPLVSASPTDSPASPQSPAAKRKSIGGGGRKSEVSLERRIHMGTLIAKAANLSIGSESGGASPVSAKSAASSPVGSNSPKAAKNTMADWMPKSGRVIRKMPPKFEKKSQDEEGAAGVYSNKLFERKALEKDTNGPNLFSDVGDSSGDASFLSAKASGAAKAIASSDQTWFNYGSDGYEDAMDISADDSDANEAEVPDVSDYASEVPKSEQIRAKSEQPSRITNDDLEDVRKDTTIFSQNVTDHGSTWGLGMLTSPAYVDEASSSDAAYSNASSMDSIETPPGATHIVIAANEPQHKSSPVLVFKEPKIIAPNHNSPSVGDMGLRRSERNRLPRLDPHYQRPVYRRDEKGNDMLVGVESNAVWDRLLKKYRVTDTAMAAERERDRIHHKRLEKKRQEEFRKRRFRM